MSTSLPDCAGRPLPGWLQAGASLLIVAHLGAVLLLVLSVASGPWPAPAGFALAPPPAFVQSVAPYTTKYYLLPLKLVNNYHFMTNRPMLVGLGASIEVRLKDEKGYPLKDDKGNPLKPITLPDNEANFWVRHRQILLARALVDDQNVEPGQERIFAPNQRVRTIPFWDGVGEWSIALRSVPEHLVPRDREVKQPSPWSLLLARSYVRHLCREHGAASAELIRHSREPLPPNLLGSENPPAGAFAELLANFGEMPR